MQNFNVLNVDAYICKVRHPECAWYEALGCGSRELSSRSEHHISGMIGIDMVISTYCDGDVFMK